ncbi:MAG: SBBP repeat-containing protein, partial [Candidatus Pacearchaeota archaeon]
MKYGLLGRIMTVVFLAGRGVLGNNGGFVSLPVERWLSKKGESGFLENRGQMMDMEGRPVPFVLFKAEAPGINLWITEKGITLQTIKVEGEHRRSEVERKMPGREAERITLYWDRIDVELKGARIKRENIVKEGSSVTDFNFFYPHCPNGIYGVKEYEKITIKEVYPGIDGVWYKHPQKGYKYDFVVHPGADYKQIELVYRSKTPVKINERGELELYTEYGNIKENTPVSYYQGKTLNTKFKLLAQKPIIIHGDKGFETRIGFELPGLPSPKGEGLRGELIIDPQLWWATFYGGSGYDAPMSIDIDNGGNVFVVGYTTSLNFPTQNAGTFFQGIFAGVNDAFMLKFNNSGILLGATYYGGSGDDIAHSLAIDGAGNVFIAGHTNSPNFPVQNGGTFFQGVWAGFYDAFILKFDNSGILLWATYYGGSGDDDAYFLITDGNGNVFVTGTTNSSNFPVQNAGTFFQGVGAGFYDAFISKFDNAGNLLWATYYGGSAEDMGSSISTDAAGNVFITGFTKSGDFPTQNAGTFFQGTYAGSGGNNGLWYGDAFILKFDNAGNCLWATYYGGSGDDWGSSIAIDGSGNVFIAGRTESFNFPTQNAGTFFQGSISGNVDAFILKFDNVGNRLWATYYGGSGNECYYYGIMDHLAIDNCGNIYLSFETSTTNFPYLVNSCDAGYYDNTYNGGGHDVVISFFSNNGTLLWCTYFGGDGDDFRTPLAIDVNNNLFASGEWTQVNNSASYPTTAPGGGSYYDPIFNGGIGDGFIAKFCSNACICLPYNGCTVNCNLSVMAGSNSPVCEGGILNLSCNLGGMSVYSWSGPNGFTSAQQNPVVNNIAMSGAGWYYVTVTDGSGCSGVDSVQVVVNAVPV